MRIFWYAPFNNAYEHLVAEHVALPGDTLVVQSMRTRFGEPQPSDAETFVFLRDLPELLTDPHRSLAAKLRRPAHRGRLAAERSLRRWTAVHGAGYEIAHIHTVDILTDAMALPLLRRAVKHLVLSVHNVRPHVSRLPRRLETASLSRAYGAARLVLVAHSVLADQLQAEFGVPPSRIRLVPLVVPPVVDSTRREEGGDAVRVLFFGTFRANKGMPVLMDAIRRTQVADTPLMFHVAGRGDPDLERMVREMAGADPRVKFDIGYVSDERRADLFRAADLLVLPYSAIAAQSGVLSDAYAYGVPAIVTDAGPMGLAVSADGTGWVVPPNDSPALERTILKAAADQTGRDVRRRTMLQLAGERSPERVAALIRREYTELAGS